MSLLKLAELPCEGGWSPYGWVTITCQALHHPKISLECQLYKRLSDETI